MFTEAGNVYWICDRKSDRSNDRSNDLNKSKDIAFKAAAEAGKLIASRVGDVRKIDYKGVANIVTDVDKAAEAKIIDIIRSQFPDDEILAEESGRSVGSKTSRCWLIDPLDGTTNFAHTYPFFSVSIALVEAGRQVLGVVFNPVSNELFWAVLGEGAWLNDTRLRVSGIKTLGESLLATGFASSRQDLQSVSMEQFRRLTAVSHGVRRDGSAALDLCFVACGRLDGYWERKLAPWDLGAGTLIVEEAGGKVTNLVNGTLDLSKGHVAATNGLIHDEMITALDDKATAQILLPPGD